MKNRRWILGLIFILLLIAVFAFFDYKGVFKTNSVLSLENLKNATYKINDKEFNLKNGSYSDSSDNFNAKLDNENISNIADKSAVIINTNEEGGTGQYKYLVVMGIENNQPKYLSNILIDDRAIINKLDFSDNKITVSAIVHGPNDPMCCPTLEKTLVYDLTNDNKLVLQGNSDIKQEVAGVKTSNKPISKDDAVLVVKNLPEVQQFINKSGWSPNQPGITSKPFVEFSSEENDYYSIHVYELVKDSTNNKAHSATFNWYKVDKNTGKIKCSFTDEGCY